MNNKPAATYHGRPCKTCGGTKRYKSNCACIACQYRTGALDAEYARLYRRMRPEVHRAATKKWRLANPDTYRRAQAHYKAKLRNTASLVFYNRFPWEIKTEE